MSARTRLLTALSTFLVVGCGASAAAPTDAGSTVAVPDAQSIGDADAYPSSNPGYNARKGSIPGNQIRDYKFKGYPNGDISKGLQTISLSDYYDPTGKLGYKLLHLGVAALWCGPCNQETQQTVPLVPMYLKKGVVFVQALDQGAAVDVAATTMDLTNWITKYKSNFTEMLDPDDANLGGFYDSAALPWNAIIDTRTMEILTAGTGYSGNVEGDVDPWLTWVAQNPPSYPTP